MEDLSVRPSLRGKLQWTNATAFCLLPTTGTDGNFFTSAMMFSWILNLIIRFRPDAQCIGFLQYSRRLRSIGVEVRSSRCYRIVQENFSVTSNCLIGMVKIEYRADTGMREVCQI